MNHDALKPTEMSIGKSLQIFHINWPFWLKLLVKALHNSTQNCICETRVHLKQSRYHVQIVQLYKIAISLKSEWKKRVFFIVNPVSILTI